MAVLSRKNYKAATRPVRIMQFGEGNFLRAFVDYMLQVANEKGVMDSNVVVVQPLPSGRVKELAKQDGLYTLLMEGVENQKIVKDHRVIDVISDFIDPYTEYDKFLSYARDPELQIVVSNTTEAGIAYDSNDTDWSKCPTSFPGKLLALLWERYQHFNGDYSKGLVIVPCELIDFNGTTLKSVMDKLANLKGLGRDFTNWLNNANSFVNTLVDRIVPGYPADQAKELEQELGYIDNSMVKSEIFHLWVLEGNDDAKKRFPIHKTGLNVIYANSIVPYKERKVKILNGSHTALVPIAYFMGIETVGEAVKNKKIASFLNKLITEDINPTINLPKDQKDAYAASVLERFSNPFISHMLMSIALNSTTKFKTRLLPTIEDYIKELKTLPNAILFAFAALIKFHRGYRGDEKIDIKDDPEYIKRWNNVWTTKSTDYMGIAKTVAGWKDIWGYDLSELHRDLVKVVAGYLESIDTKGMEGALNEFLGIQA